MNTQFINHNLNQFLDTLGEKEMALLFELLKRNLMLESKKRAVADAEEQHPDDESNAVAPLSITLTSDRSSGYIEEKMINGCGPYKYLRYRQEGKLKSKYIGK